MINLLKSIAKKLLALLFPNKVENIFYTNLFTRSPDWCKPQPNYEEALRWNIIDSFLKYIYHENSSFDPLKIKILDLGCGRGWLSNLLSTYGHVTGIEPVKAVVKHANKLFPNLDIRSGSAETLLKEGKINHYDIIVCSEVIEHIPEKKKKLFLFKLKKLLRKNGFLIITTPRKDAEQEWLKYSNPGQPIEDWLSEASLASLFEHTSFLVHKKERFSIPPHPDAPEIEIYQLWLVQNK